jgi:hypothetical protein
MPKPIPPAEAAMVLAMKKIPATKKARLAMRNTPPKAKVIAVASRYIITPCTGGPFSFSSSVAKSPVLARDAGAIGTED